LQVPLHDKPVAVDRLDVCGTAYQRDVVMFREAGAVRAADGAGAQDDDAHEVETIISAAGADPACRFRSLEVDVNLSSFLAGIVAGAGIAFALDPVNGGRRRSLLLVERVRATLGRVSSHPRAIEVLDTDVGEVTLRGAVLTAEADRVIAAAGSVIGVNGVVDLLDRHESSDDVAALQGGSVLLSPRLDILPRRWSPATRTLIGAAALAAAAVSMTRLPGHGHRP
jgi:hypothetical protein